MTEPEITEPETDAPADDAPDEATQAALDKAAWNYEHPEEAEAAYGAKYPSDKAAEDAPDAPPAAPAS